jgi:hypothetical protein
MIDQEHKSAGPLVTWPLFYHISRPGTVTLEPRTTQVDIAILSDICVFSRVHHPLYLHFIPIIHIQTHLSY